jgi:hypothetical protein
MRSSRIIASAAALLLLSLSTTSWSTDVFLVNFDPPGLGLNDPTPAEPVGGNAGTTVGEQRVNVYLDAARIWAETLQSDVPILVGATFQPLPCDANGGVLGAAGPWFVHSNFPGATLPDTWYVDALADALSGINLGAGLGAPADIDIISFFNSELGTPGCLENTAWYYGLDNNNDPSEIDFHAVVSHEIAHGLGFLELASEGSGALLAGLPDAYLVNMRDLTTDKQWDEMTDAERLASQVNSGNLVWTGPSVTADAPFILGPRPSAIVLNPKGVAGSYEVQQASYGPGLRENGGTSAKMVVVDDGVGVGSDGCEPIQNNVSGKIAVIDRGACAFAQKTFFAQIAGAKGVIVVNNQPGGLPPMGGADDPFFAIPSVGVSNADGSALKEAAARNSVVKLILDPSLRAGMQDGFVRLYAPNPVAPGSSKSHFDTTATPNLLMEPAINDDLMPSVFLDLTPNLFEDIGWTLQ